MTQPLVCAVCLTKDRPVMLQRAIRSFRAQTYENKRMLIMDTGVKAADPTLSRDGVWIARLEPQHETIGALRNIANSWTHLTSITPRNPDILMHWDDDDWSAPTRMAENVAALKEQEPWEMGSKWDAVGYSDMLFWAGPIGLLINEQIVRRKEGEAWLYTAPHQKPDSVLGTSLAYWRETWERKPFLDTSRGEDKFFCEGLRVKQMSSLRWFMVDNPGLPPQQPMMVASIHGGNTCSQILPGHEQWRRTQEWDARLKEIMAL